MDDKLLHTLINTMHTEPSERDQANDNDLGFISCYGHESWLKTFTEHILKLISYLGNVICQYPVKFPLISGITFVEFH